MEQPWDESEWRKEEVQQQKQQRRRRQSHRALFLVILSLVVAILIVLPVIMTRKGTNKSSSGASSSLDSSSTTSVSSSTATAVPTTHTNNADDTHLTAATETPANTAPIDIQPSTSFPTTTTASSSSSSSSSPTSSPTKAPTNTLPAAPKPPTNTNTNTNTGNMDIMDDVLDKNNGCYPLECMPDKYLSNTRDRLTHNAPIYAGQALCNGDPEKYPDVTFQFGMTRSGRRLVWQNCSLTNRNDSKVIVLANIVDLFPTSTTTNDDDDNNNNNKDNHHHVYFQMTPQATWQILQNTSTTTTNNNKNGRPNNIILWQHEVQNQNQIVQPSACLSNPKLDCPYIHFRRHGDVIMNYIGNQGWVACKSKKICYADLFP